MGRFKTSIKRLFFISVLTASLTSLITLFLFWSSFKEKLLFNVVEDFIERRFDCKIELKSMRAISFMTYLFEGFDYSSEGFWFTSDRLLVEFKIVGSPQIGIRRLELESPYIVFDLDSMREEDGEGEGGEGGEGSGEGLISRLLDAEVSMVDGEVLIKKGERQYRFSKLQVDGGWILGRGIFNIYGHALTSGGGDGVTLDSPITVLVKVIEGNSDPELWAYILTSNASFRLDALELDAGGVKLVGYYDGEKIDISWFELSGLTVNERGMEINLDDISSQGRATYFLEGPISLNEVHLEIPGSGRIKIDELVINRGLWEMKASGENLIVSEGNLRRLGKLIPGYLKEWDLSGGMNGEVSVGNRDSGGEGIAGEVSLLFTNISFSSPDWLYMGEGLDGDLKLAWEKGAGEDGLNIEANLNVRDFQLLLGDFFMDFTLKSLSASLEGRIRDEARMEGFEFSLKIPRAVKAKAEGNLQFQPSGMRGNVVFDIENRDMGYLFDLIFKDFFEERFPALYDAKMDGRLHVRGKLKKGGATTLVSGLLTLNAPLIEVPADETEIEDLYVLMPFSLDFSGGVKGREIGDFREGEFGEISFDRALLKGVEVSGMTLYPACIDNSVAFSGDPVVRLLGGEVELRDFIMTDIIPDMNGIADTRLNLSLDIRGLDISRMFSKDEMIRPTGSISGHFEEFKISDKKLFTSGGITANIFNGVIYIEDLWGEDIFGFGRRVGMDFRFEDINLGSLTEEIDVGKIKGVVEGSLYDFVFSYGEPESFVFDVMTVDRPGTKKRVSVDFIDNITILGSGYSIFSGILNKGVNRFISEYRYSELGIHLELKNDYFTLNGKIRGGDTEYFIRRGSLSGINIINQNPNNKIRFKDMMERINRIKVKNTEDIRIETK